MVSKSVYYEDRCACSMNGDTFINFPSVMSLLFLRERMRSKSQERKGLREVSSWRIRASGSGEAISGE